MILPVVAIASVLGIGAGALVARQSPTSSTSTTAPLSSSNPAPNWDKGFHVDGDPYGSWRVRRKQTKEESTFGFAFRGVLNLFGLGLSSDGADVIIEELWCDAQYPTACKCAHPTWDDGAKWTGKPTAARCRELFGSTSEQSSKCKGS